MTRDYIVAQLKSWMKPQHNYNEIGFYEGSPLFERLVGAIVKMDQVWLDQVTQQRKKDVQNEEGRNFAGRTY